MEDGVVYVFAVWTISDEDGIRLALVFWSVDIAADDTSVVREDNALVFLIYVLKVDLVDGMEVISYW